MEIPCPANPTGGVVVMGDAQIQSTFPGLTTIHQQTNNAVINWSTFNIGSGEHTNFIVPSATSATLNRVLDGGPSLLNGTLTSNGQVFLINASGIGHLNSILIYLACVKAIVFFLLLFGFAHSQVIFIMT